MSDTTPSDVTAKTVADDSASTDSPPTASRPRRWVWPTVLGALVAVLLAGGGVWYGVSALQGGAGDGGSGEFGGGGNVQLYQSGMHPWIITTEPGNCPICGMKLEPINASKLTGELAIDPVVVQNMGVRTQPVVSIPAEELTRTIRTVGRVTYDEGGVRTVNTKIDGWIEELFVDTEGERVEAGQRLFSVYSPQLYAAQEEYLAVHRRQRDRPAEAGLAEAGSADLLGAARQRLRYLDLSDEQIAELEERGEPIKAVTVRSPFAGVVTGKHANEGMRIDPGMVVFTLADLSRVWVVATVYERQLPFLREGATARMELDYLPGRVFEGRVDYIYPYLEDRGREVKVRLVFDNEEGVLKPGMFAQVRIEGSPPVTMEGEGEGEREVVLVPRSAVIDTGERRVAFVSLGRGRFEPRELELGVSLDDDLVQVLSGLEAGEEVVTSGQFLLDSESRLRESLAKMVSPTVVSAGGAGAVEVAPIDAPPADAPAAGPLSAEQLRAVLAAQTHCPVTGLTLGSMGPPIQIEYRGETVRLCCDGCIGAFEDDPTGYLAKLREAQR